MQEVAFTLASGMAYVQAALDAGLKVDDFAPRLAFFFNGHNNVFQEVAKFRAARNMWAHAMKERFGAQDERSMMLRFHTQTGGVTLTAQQPQNNVVRVALQAFAAVCGGTQSLHTNGYDEALALPTERAAKIALRTQQIIAHESGATDTVDPFAGSYFVESLTAEIERRAWKLIERVDELGGSVNAIAFIKGEIEDSAFGYHERYRTEQDVVVGVNRYVEEDVEVEDTLTVDPATERAQIERLKAFKADRDQELAGAATRGAARGRRAAPPTCCRRSAPRSPTAARSARYAAHCATSSGSISLRSSLARRFLLALVLLLVAPASAQAAFEVRSFTVTPSGLAAGSHPNVSVAIGFAPYDSANPPERPRDLTISLPPGLVGNPNATGKCSQAQFQADNCPASTRVGTTSVTTTIPALLGMSTTADGDVYNLVPGAGEPARLGVVVRPPLGADKVFIVSPVALRSSDGGLDSIITNLPQKVGIPLLGQQDMWIESMNLTLLGKPPGGAATPFMTLPTSCGPATASIAARSATGTQVTRAAPPFTPTACDKLPFAPQIAATIDNSRTPALRTVITGPPGNANTATAAVTLPAGISVNLDALGRACTLEQQAAGPCPESARVGRAVARSPLLPALTGPVFLAAQAGQPLPGIRVDLSGVVSLSLTGTVGGNPLRTEFAGIPDVPLERFELAFDKGGALRAVTDVCRGPLPRIAADLKGHNGATATLREPITVTGCVKPAANVRLRGRRLRLGVAAVRGGPALRLLRLTLPRALKAHPRSGRIRTSAGTARLTGRGVLTIRTPAVRHIAVTLSRGAVTRRTRGALKKFKLTTLDESGRHMRQRLTARR